MHSEPHPLAGQAVRLADGDTQAVVEDWADRVFGRSWMDMDGNPLAFTYAVRSAADGLPIDNNVLYCKLDNTAYLVHVSELAPAEHGTPAPETPSAEQVAEAIRILTAAWTPTVGAGSDEDFDDEEDLGDECGCGGFYDVDPDGTGTIPMCTCGPGCHCESCAQDAYDRAARCSATVTDPEHGYLRGCGRPARLEVTAWQASTLTGPDPDHAAQCTSELHHACGRAEVELGHRLLERQAGTACTYAHARLIGDGLPEYEQRAGGGGWYIRPYTHLPYRGTLPTALDGLLSHTELAQMAARAVWEYRARQNPRGGQSALGWARQCIVSAASAAAQLSAADLNPGAAGDDE